MISVPNRRQQLSGSNALLMFLLLILFIGCATTSGTNGRTTILEPDKPKEEVIVEERIVVDTINWTIASVEDFPPISPDMKVASYGLEKVSKEYYQIALMLPMRIQQDIPTIDANNKKFADFYAGIRMAAEETDGVRAHFKVYYTNRNEARVDEIIQDMSYDKPDLIIGPYESKLISKMANFAKENRIPMVSPWKSNAGLTEDNLFFLQMRPGIEQYYKRIVDHVNFNFDRTEVGIIQRPEGPDKAKSQMIERINQESSDLPVVQPYEVFNIEMDSLMDSETNVFDTLLTQGFKAFIIPHFSSRDESYIYSCLRKMYGEKNDRELYVYAMPVALNSERIDINILKNLDIRTAEFRFPDPMNPDVQEFRKLYNTKYGWLPGEDAYYGHDLMKFIIYGLKEHGQYFHYYMAGEPLELMQMKINIAPYFKDQDDDYPDFLVNEHLYIIEYDTDHFEITDIR